MRVGLRSGSFFIYVREDIKTQAVTEDREIKDKNAQVKRVKRERKTIMTEVSNQGNAQETTETTVEQKDSNNMSYEELLKINAEQIKKMAELEVQNRKLNQLKDKNLSKIGNLEKELQKRMTDAEQAEIEIQEKRREDEERFAELERYKNINEATKRYARLGMNMDMSEQAAEAEINGNMDLLAEIYRQYNQQTLKNAEAQWIKSRPEINAGGEGETTVTQEQFNAMGMMARTAFRKEYPDAYKRLHANEK